MKKLSGKITVGKSFGGRSDEMPVHIEIDDEISGCRILHVSMTLENFADAVFGQGWTPCQLEFNDTAPIGMKAENKTETVPFDMFKDATDARINKALKPFEVEGWRARREDMANGHCRTEGGQRVVFYRHVDPETGKPVEVARD